MATAGHAALIKLTLLSIWNPGNTGSTIGVDDARLVTLPEANRISLVQVNKLACALLLEKWRIARQLLHTLSPLDAQLCTLRGAVLALRVFDSAEDGEHRQFWQRAASDFCRHALTGMGHEQDGMWARGARAILERCPDLLAREDRPVDIIASQLAVLSEHETRGAALAGAALLVGALLMTDFRQVRTLAHEQLALAVAFASGESLSHDGGHVTFTE